MADDDFSRIGGLISHAEALQKQAAALAKSSEVAQDRMLEILTEFIEVHKGFADQNQQTREIAGSLGRHAFEGGRAAVRAEIRGAVKDVPMIIAGALEAETAPIRTVVSENIVAMETARTSLNDAKKHFSRQAFVTSGLTMLTATAIAVSGSLGYWLFQREAVASGAAQVAQSDARVAVLHTTIADLERKASELEAKGARIQIEQCPIAGSRRTRPCVAVDPAAPIHTINGKQYRPTLTP